MRKPINILIAIAAALILGSAHLLDGPTETEASTDVAAEVATLEHQHSQAANAQATAARRQAQAEYMALALERAR